MADLLGDIQLSEDGVEDEEEPRRKVRAVQSTASKQIEQLYKAIMLLMRLSLWNTQQIRSIITVTMVVLKVPEDCAFMKAVRAALDMYNRAVENLKKASKTQDEIREALGSPHHHVFNALVKLLPSSKEHCNKLKEYVKLLAQKKGYFSEIQKHVPVLKIGKMYQREYKKLEFSAPLLHFWRTTASQNNVKVEEMDEGQYNITIVWHVVLEEVIMKTEKVKELEGTAPRGAMEREVQTLLESMQNS